MDLTDDEREARARDRARPPSQWCLADIIPGEPDDATLRVVAMLAYTMTGWLEQLPQELIDGAAASDREAQHTILRLFRPTWVRQDGGQFTIESLPTPPERS
ncbi:MAG: hypothetical protein MUE41_17185 [Gemmatimonadaceae bacterium]|jgi:hypothetical protein|nr:hypothetical protein [Gemmatimonadaceae bacterium]